MNDCVDYVFFSSLSRDVFVYHLPLVFYQETCE